MKRLILILLAVAFVVAPAFAADKVVKATIQSAIEKNGSDGMPYIRFIINENRVKTIGGVEYPYTVGVTLMCFGDLVEEARKLAQGDELHAIAQEREWQGRKSYVLLKFLASN
jgi:hypothetical protein